MYAKIFLYDFREYSAVVPVFLFRQKANSWRSHDGTPSGKMALKVALSRWLRRRGLTVSWWWRSIFVKNRAGCCILPFISRRHLSDTSMAPDPADVGTQILTNAPGIYPSAVTGEKTLPVLNFRPSRWNRST